jgi:hypothetical protein
MLIQHYSAPAFSTCIDELVVDFYLGSRFTTVRYEVAGPQHHFQRNVYTCRCELKLKISSHQKRYYTEYKTR